MFDKTNVDGIMIGRGTLGNPWIFKKIISTLNNEEYLGHTKEEKLKTILKHYDMLTAEKGEYTAVREMRKHVSFYIKGMENATTIRNEINSLEDEDKIKKILIDFFKK